MTSRSKHRQGPIEVHLTQPHLSILAHVHYDDGHIEVGPTVIKALNLRGAQREITSRLIADGYAPAGRWETVTLDGEDMPYEVARKFRPVEKEEK